MRRLRHRKRPLVGVGKPRFIPKISEKTMETWRRLVASEEPGEVEARVRRFDGEYRWFLVRAVPVRDEWRKVIRWYGTSTDIEDRKRAEEKATPRRARAAAHHGCYS